jgi:hypothetical protein
VTIPIEEFEYDVPVDIRPDGSCPSLRLVLRAESGHAMLITLDGRLGRVLTEDWEMLPPEDVIRPEPLDEEEPEEYDVEDFEWGR